MMKKLIMAVLLLSMVAGLVACGGTGSSDTGKGSENAGNESQVESNTSESEESEEDGKVVYKVTVVDESGNPVAGTMVQVCTDETCFAPVTTDENGVAEFRLEEADGYKTKLITGSDDDYVYFEAGSTEATITVEAE